MPTFLAESDDDDGCGVPTAPPLQSPVAGSGITTKHGFNK
jgi:hypothetical protein